MNVTGALSVCKIMHISCKFKSAISEERERQKKRRRERERESVGVRAQTKGKTN